MSGDGGGALGGAGLRSAVGSRAKAADVWAPESFVSVRHVTLSCVQGVALYSGSGMAS
jgi:hypothetical protein